jgi:hypothetical protein
MSLALYVTEVECVLVKSNSLGRLHALSFRIDVGGNRSCIRALVSMPDVWIRGWSGCLVHG